jgi:putative ABC transport system permease protein
MVISSPKPDRIGFGHLKSAWLLLRLLCLERLLVHPWQALIGALAISAGVTLFFSVVILNASVKTSFETLVHALGGEAVWEVTDFGEGAISISAYERIRKLSAIKKAAPILERPALLRGTRGALRVTVLGVDRGARDIMGVSEHAIESWHVSSPLTAVVSEEVLRELGEPPGGILTLAFGDRSFRISLGGALRAAGPGKSLYGRFVVIPLPLAQWLFQKPDQVSSILIAPDEANAGSGDQLTGLIRATVGEDLLVLPVMRRAEELDQAIAPVRSFSAFVSLLALLTGSYLIFNSVAMRIRQERHDMGILLAIGESRTRLLFRAWLQAGILGLAGSLMGLAVGYFVADELVESVPPLLQGLSAAKARLMVPVWAPFLAAAMGMTAAIAGSVVPTFSVANLSLVEALRSQPAENLSAHRSRPATLSFVGFGMLGCAVLLEPWTQSLTVVPLVVAFAGSLAAIPFLFRVAVRALYRGSLDYPFRFGAGVVQVMAASVQENLTRSALTMIAITLSVASVVAIGGASANLADSIRPFANAVAELDVYVSSVDDPYLSVPIGNQVARVLKSTEGVDEIYELRAMFVHWQGRKIWLRGDDPEAVRDWAFIFTQGDRFTAANGIDDGGILISTQVAQRVGVRRGDTVFLPTREGEKPFQVVGVIESWSWPEGTFVISSEAFIRLFGEHSPNQLAIKLSNESVKKRIQEVLTEAHPNVTVYGGEELRDRILKAQQSQVAPFTLVRYMAVLMVAIMVLNTMMIAVFEREREIGLLRAVGMSRGQLALAVFVEIGFLVLTATGTGLLLGALFQHLGLSFINAATGLPLRGSLSGQPFWEGFLAAVAAAISGAAYPALRACRQPIVQSISYE